jgi:intracellular multiplication protein IcmO
LAGVPAWRPAQFIWVTISKDVNCGFLRRTSYDLTLDWNKQRTEEPSKQHGFAQFYFTRTFELLGVSLGHIFKVEQSDVDMRDVVLNRRILVVNLPALESSDERLAALGKIVVASLRGMMAQMLGARLEGDYSTIVANKPGMGSAPFHVVLDEVAYYATSGMDRMLAMGRGLNFMFWLGFQEVSGIWARLGEKTQSLFGNANLTIVMRQQDANRTRQWIEDTAGKTYVTQATSYQGGGTGEYAETRSAEVREVAGVDWRDLQSLIEGEAIILFGGRRIYAKLFHAEIDTRGPMRLNRPIPMAPPDTERLKAQNERVEGILRAFERGLWTARTNSSVTLTAMLEAFKGAANSGQGGDACVAAALEVAKDHPMAREEPEALAPRSPLEAMLASVADRPLQASFGPLPGYVPGDPTHEAQLEASGTDRDGGWCIARRCLGRGHISACGGSEGRGAARGDSEANIQRDCSRDLCARAGYARRGVARRRRAWRDRNRSGG